jgi:hypothetical protein
MKIAKLETFTVRVSSADCSDLRSASALTSSGKLRLVVEVDWRA